MRVSDQLSPSNVLAKGCHPRTAKGCHPREGGDPFKIDSRFRGNDTPYSDSKKTLSSSTFAVRIFS